MYYDKWEKYWEYLKMGCATILVSIVLLSIGFTAGFIVKDRYFSEQDIVNQIDDEQLKIEYLRGAYDMCVALGLSLGFGQRVGQEKVQDGCLAAVKYAEDQNWYGFPSDGWQYPLPEIITQEK